MIRRLLFVILLLTTPSFAYVPPSFFLVKQLAKKHSDLSNVVLKYRVSFQDGTNFTENLYIDGSEFDVVLKNNEGLIIGSAKKSLAQAGLYYKVAYSSSFSTLFSALENAGMPLKTETQLYANKDSDKPELPYKPETVVSIGRHSGKILWILNGDGAKTLNPPQIWVEKNSYLPLRTIFRSDNGDTFDVVTKLHGIHQNSFVPKLFEVSKNGNSWCKAELIEITALKERPKTHGKVSEHAGGNTENIEQYIKWIH